MTSGNQKKILTSQPIRISFALIAWLRQRVLGEAMLNVDSQTSSCLCSLHDMVNIYQIKVKTLHYKILYLMRKYLLKLKDVFQTSSKRFVEIPPNFTDFCNCACVRKDCYASCVALKQKKKMTYHLKQAQN